MKNEKLDETKANLKFRLPQLIAAPSENKKQFAEYDFMKGLIEAIYDTISTYYYNHNDQAGLFTQEDGAEQQFIYDFHKWVGLKEGLEDIKQYCAEEKIPMKEQPLGNLIIDAIFGYFAQGRSYDNDHGYQMGVDEEKDMKKGN